MIFYDFEVFKYDWLVVAMDMNSREEQVIINDADRLEALYNAHKNDIWVGYNSNHYDQYILKGILCGFDPKEINDFIIVKKNDGWKFSSLLRKFPLISYDVMLGTDKGLKTFEGFLGNSIKESSVDFNIKRKLTTEEIAETVKYCRHDVEHTIEIFFRRIDEFNTMMFFIKHFNYPLSDLSKTKAQLAAKIVGANHKGKTFDDEFKYPIVDCIELKKYKHVADWYKNPVNQDYSKSQEDIIVAGVPHTFSWGGGHGARKKFHTKGDFLIIDATAYYPTMQKRFKFGYRVMDNPENFEFIHDSNIEFKRKGDKKARLPFKIMDNAIGGQMKQKSSALYDPMSNNSICVNGQLLLLDLVEHLEPYSKLIQNNTDGIAIQLMDYDRDFDIIDRVVSEFEKRTGILLEFETFFGEIFQKDVNNYMLIDRENGAVKAKGSYVKKLSELDYDLPILNRALVEYMLNGVPVEKTINECNILKDFQKIVKISGAYSHGLYNPKIEEKKIRNEAGKLVKIKVFTGGEVQNEKTFRVFASKRTSDGGIYKVKNANKNPEKFANTPERCFIVNEAVNDMPIPEHLDKKWYIDFAKSRLRDFGVKI